MMNDMVLTPDTFGAIQTVGLVTAIIDGKLSVTAPDGMYRVARAVSCLVEPEPGDRVLLAGANTNDLFVLAVLERPTKNDAKISTDGNLTVELGSGRFVVAATEGVHLVSKKTVSVTSERLEAQVNNASLLCSTARLCARALETVLDRLLQRVKRSYRRVEDLDHVRSGQVDYAADGQMRIHGETTLVTGETLLKAEAKQIHFG